MDPAGSSVVLHVFPPQKLATVRRPTYYQTKSPQKNMSCALIISKVSESLVYSDLADEYTRDISQEESKLLTIAVELVSEPSILFLDEP